MLWMLWSSAIAAEQWTLTYAITYGGMEVGTRTVDVTFLPTATGEMRLLECYTELPTAGIKQQVSGTSLDGGFASLNQQGPRGWEVQAAASPRGWNVSFKDRRGLQQSELALSEVDATSLSLLDPGTRWTPSETFRVLSAETGEVLEGPLVEVGPVSVSMEGHSLPATEYLWTSPAGEMRFTRHDESGVLLSYVTTLGGQTLQMALTELPPERSWEELDGALIGPTVQEEEL